MALSDLTDVERQKLAVLEEERRRIRGWLLLPDLYYRGEQRIQDLGISTPPSLQGLRTVVGWPRVAVEAIEERLDIEGFLLPGGSQADTNLWDVWQQNNLDEESQLGHLDALVFGHSYIVTGIDPQGNPLVTIESPYNVGCEWSPITRQITSAMQTFGPDPYSMSRDKMSMREIELAESQAVLYLPDEMVTLERGGKGGAWSVSNRQANPLGYVPVQRMSNRQRVSDRVGRSEITPEIMSISDAACRTLLGMEVAREFYSTPQRWMIGIDEDATTDTQGNPIDTWTARMGQIWALPRDDDGNLPQVGQFNASDPQTFTELLDAYAKIMTTQTGLPPQYLGITDLQPPSADAIRMAEQRLVKRCERRQRSFEGSWERTMQTVLQIQQGEKFNAKQAAGITTIWRDASTPTLAAQADATFKWVSGGILPARSSVTLDRAGFSVAEQQRITKDWAKDDARQNLAALAARATMPADPQFPQQQQDDNVTPQFSDSGQ